MGARGEEEMGMQDAKEAGEGGGGGLIRSSCG